MDKKHIIAHLVNGDRVELVSVSGLETISQAINRGCKMVYDDDVGVMVDAVAYFEEVEQ